jgi:hypothetical protein
MNITSTNRTIGYHLGSKAFKRGLLCTPACDQALLTKRVGLPMADSISLTEGWREGWRTEELESSRGW